MKEGYADGIERSIREARKAKDVEAELYYSQRRYGYAAIAPFRPKKGIDCCFYRSFAYTAWLKANAVKLEEMKKKVWWKS